jgi:hypothetical protein
MNWREEAADVVASLIADRGEDATYSVAGGPPAAVRGIYEEPPTETFGSSGGINTTTPAFTLAAADLPPLAKADLDTLVVLGRSFHVRVIKPDGVAAVRLQLEEAE